MNDVVVDSELRAPFPWFGGKSRVVDVVWKAFGNPPNYVEPFFGSGAVLLARPHAPKIETINDLDCHVANFWRAVTEDPEAVARWCDWPVNEADLHARHRWIVAQEEFRRRMKAEPEYFDPKVAGWWVWGLSQWIGGGWCASAQVAEQARRPEITDGGGGVHKRGRNAKNSANWNARPDLEGDGHGVHKKMPRVSSRIDGRASPSVGRRTQNRPAPGEVWEKRPVLGHGGRGVVSPTEKRPNARNGGQGVHARLVGEQLPDLSGRGKGVGSPSRLPSLGNERGVHGADKPPCLEWFAGLQSRLRRVRVCCGDWTRVLGNSVIGTTKSRNSGMNPCGIFLDPPYSGDQRAADLYGTDDGNVAKAVAAWAIAHGDDPDLRIAVCGYEGEHEFPPTWTVHAWKAHRGYAAESNANKHRERIWFSPHCLPLEDVQRSLFDVAAGGKR